MRKLLVNIVRGLALSVIFSIVLYFISYNILLSLFCGFVAFLLLIWTSIAFVLNYLFRTKGYFANCFDFLKFSNNISQELDIVNLGSSSGKYAFNYTTVSGSRCTNFAMAPQTLYYDFNILKQYVSYLKTGATVILPLCPFSGCILNFDDKYVTNRYATFLHPALIHDNISLQSSHFFTFNHQPIYYTLKLAGLRRFVQMILINKIKMRVKGDLHIVPDCDKDASGRIDSWMQQFGIKDLSEPISEENQKAINTNKEIINSMADYCKERQLQFAIVLLPVSSQLCDRFPVDFKKKYIAPLFDTLKDGDFVFLDYWDDDKFREPAMFRDSFLLNNYGSKVFTQDVIDRLC